MQTRVIRWTAAALACVALAAGHARAQEVDQFFDSGTVHDVRLSIHADDWQRLKETFLENTYYPADLTWNGVRVRNVGIRSRGQASRSDRKPGLRIDADRYISDQRFLGLKSFVLDNLVQDDSFVKEPVSMRFFARMGLPAPREAHARLYVNDVYAGLYTIVESIDKDFISRVYQWREQETGRPERDGVIFEYQWNGPYDFSYLGPELEPYSLRFEPKTHESDSPDALYGPLRDLCRLATDTSDTDFPDIVDAYLDLQQWVRYVAVENFLADVDGMLGFAGINNFYLYRFDRGIVSQVIPWDKDQAFTSATRSVWTNADQNVIMRRAMAVPELRELYLQTLRASAQLAAQPEGDDPRGWFERETERTVTQIQASAAADPVKPQTNEAFNLEVARVLEFARTRAAFVECEVANAHAPQSEARDCTSGGPPSSAGVKKSGVEKSGARADTRGTLQGSSQRSSQ